MNVNPSSEQFGNVVPWDSLTDEQKASGDWIELPAIAPGEGRTARRKSPFDSFAREYTDLKAESENAERRIERELRREHRQASGFDALGRPLSGAR